MYNKPLVVIKVNVCFFFALGILTVFDKVDSFRFSKVLQNVIFSFHAHCLQWDTGLQNKGLGWNSWQYPDGNNRSRHWKERHSTTVLKVLLDMKSDTKCSLLPMGFYAFRNQGFPANTHWTHKSRFKGWLLNKSLFWRILNVRILLYMNYSFPIFSLCLTTGLKVSISPVWNKCLLRLRQ